LIEGFAGGGIILPLSGVCLGFVFGHVGPRDAELQMGTFLASRPISNVAYGNAILKTMAKSVVISWFIWLAALAGLFGIVYMTGNSPMSYLPSQFFWWYLPGSLLSYWAASAAVCTVSLAGRPQLIMKFMCVVPFVLIGLVSFSLFALTPNARIWYTNGLVVLTAISLFCISIVLFVVAHQRGLVGVKSLVACLVVWAILSTVVGYEWQRANAFPITSYLMALGLVPFVTVPVASVPLALSWNRHR
jgi:hypothetical protein